jgi:ABC-type multidrug transport system fused ATPase/permease subunit
MPILFNRTLWENITYGFPKNSIQKSKVLNILEEMGLSKLGDIFNERFDKSVGKKGSFLSGGQRQVVWVLRALLGKSKVIILDEPTSALDDESKENVRKMIGFLSKNRTLIIITHEKELLEGMDRLIVFDNGSITSDKKL